MKSPFKLFVAGQSLIHESHMSADDPGAGALRSLLSRSDVTFTNLETTILGRHGGWPLKGSYFGYSKPDVLRKLQEMGFNMISLANNHAFDLGPSGILSTLEEAEAYGFLHGGLGRDKMKAGGMATKPLSGRNFGLLAMDAGPGPNIMYADDRDGDRMARPGVNRLAARRIFEVDEKRFNQLRAIQETFETSPLELANYAQPEDPPVVTEDELDFYGTVFHRSRECRRRVIVERESAAAQLRQIGDCAEQGHFVVAYLHHHHWEPNWQTVPEWVRDFAYDCIDAGAKIFVSHGVPALQPIEIYAGAPIFYGLGNFIFQTSNTDTFWKASEVWRSVVATCQYDTADRLVGIDLHPIAVGGGHVAEESAATARWSAPALANGQVGQDILGDLAVRCRDYGTSIRMADGYGHIDP